MRHLIAALLVLPSAAFAADAIPGPIVATVISVYDGDTMTVNAYPWPGPVSACGRHHPIGLWCRQEF